MAYADPQSITITGTAYSLPRVPSEDQNRIGKFSGNDGNTVVTVHQNSTNSRFRREFRLTSRKVAADPITAQNKELSASCVVVIDEPRYGFTDAELIALYTAITSSLSAGSNAKLVQLLNGEL